MKDQSSASTHIHTAAASKVKVIESLIKGEKKQLSLTALPKSIAATVAPLLPIPHELFTSRAAKDTDDHDLRLILKNAVRKIRDFPLIKSLSSV